MERQDGEAQDPSSPEDSAEYEESGPEEEDADTTGGSAPPTGESPSDATQEDTPKHTPKQKDTRKQKDAPKQKNTPDQTSTAERPGAILDGLNAALQGAGATAAQSQQASEQLEADVTQLQREYDELGKAVEAYANGRSSLSQQLDERTAYIEGKRQLITSAIDERRGEVDDAWQAFESRLNALKEERSQLWDELIKAQEEQAKAERARDRATQTFEELLGRQAALTAQLTSLGDLRIGIEAADDANDALGMYVRLLEHNRVVAEVQGALRTSVDQYRSTLEEAWSAVADAKTALRKGRLDATTAQSRFDLTKAELERLRSQRVDGVLKQLPEPAVTAGSAASSGA
jgi:chromosome segregation ATPase